MVTCLMSCWALLVDHLQAFIRCFLTAIEQPFFIFARKEETSALECCTGQCKGIQEALLATYQV